MSTRTRLGIANAILALILVWPPLQHGLVRSFDMNPWGFFGFAMYTVPNLRVNVRVGVVDPETAQVDWNANPSGARGSIHPYTIRRASWGELLPPDALAAEVFAQDEALSKIVIRIRRWVLDRESARVVSRDRDYAYESEAPR